MTDAERELRDRELHHFETEQENANLRAQLDAISRLCDETDIETHEATQAWLVNNIRAVLRG